MLKKTLIAAAAVAASALALQPVEQAQAKVQLHIGVGVPVYTPYYYGPYNHYRPAPRYYYKPKRHRYGRISCYRARSIIRAHGYHHIRAIDCSGRRYTFHAKRHGIWYRLRMRSSSGKIYKVQYL